MSDRLRAAAEAALEALVEADPLGRAGTIAKLRAALAEKQDAEPVAQYSDIVSDGGMDPRNKYDHAPRREWVGLTDEERRGIREHQKLLEELGPVWSPMLLYYYLAIEQALKDKNA